MTTPPNTWNEEADPVRSRGFSVRGILWPLGLSLVVLLVIGWFTFEPGAFGLFAERVDPRILGLAVLALGARVFFGGWRLSWISNGKLNLANGLRGQLAWDFSSNISPALLGGAPLAAVYISQNSRLHGDHQVGVGEAGALMLFTMLLDNCWFALSACAALAMTGFMEIVPVSLGRIGMITSVTYLAFFMLWTGLFGYGILFRPDLLARLAGWAVRIPGLRRFQQHVERETAGYHDSVAAIRTRPASFFVKGFLLTAGTWLGRYLLAVFVIWSVVPNLDLALATLRSIAMTLGSLILPTPGGAGGVEGLYALFMGPLMPSAFVVPTLLSWRFLAYYIFIAVGVPLTTWHIRRTVVERAARTPVATNGRARQEPVADSLLVAVGEDIEADEI